MCRVQYTCGKLEISVITVVLGPARAPIAVAVFVLHGKKTLPGESSATTLLRLHVIYLGMGGVAAD